MGRVTAGPHVRAACRRHIDDMEHAGERGWRFDLQLVDRAIGFFRDVLRLNGGEFEAVPFLLEPWQAFIIGSLFGWVDEAGHRRFRTAFVEIGKGNGKSPLAAGVGLYCLMSDKEARAEVYAAASKKDQAMILFRDAVAMVKQSPDLLQRLNLSGGFEDPDHISYPKTSSWFCTISSDATSQSGPRPHCALVDEVHEHQNAAVINMLSAGFKGRRQPLQFEITNSGFDRQSICYQHHDYSVHVVAAKPGDQYFDDQWFAYVCALDEGDDPFEDESCWIKANPNLGTSIQPSYLRKEVREAQGMPAKASTVKRLNFCMWVDAENPWVSGNAWLPCEQDLTEDELFEDLDSCDEVVGALDLSGTTDLTALALVGIRDAARTRPAGDGQPLEELIREVCAGVEFWTPKDTLRERAKRDKVHYDIWEREGYVVATPGRSVDYRWVAQRLAEIQVRLPQFRRLAFDPYRIKYLERELAEANVELKLIPHPQGYFKPREKPEPDPSMPVKPNDPDKVPVLWMPHSLELSEEAITEGRLRVRKNPCLRWNVASVVAVADKQNNRIFDKRKSRGRIDGVVALAMAVGLAFDGAPSKAVPGKVQMFIL